MRASLLLFLIFLLAPLPTVVAATINVDSGCTLSQAIESANDDDAPDGSTCEDGSGADTIELDGNKTLTASVETITSSMTVDGNGYTITGGGSDSSFRFVAISGGTVTLDNMTITNFRAGEGGAVHISGSSTVVTIEDSTLSSNHGTSLGGAVFVESGTLHSRRNIYHNNATAGHGGAIMLEGGVSGTNHTVTKDFFTSNSSDTSGRGYTHPAPGDHQIQRLRQQYRRRRWWRHRHGHGQQRHRHRKQHHERQLRQGQ